MELLATVRVRTYELDSFGHVNNSVYLNYLEEARSEYLRALGLSFNDLAALGVHLVIVESWVKYLSPARYGDTLTVAGAFSNVKAVSLRIDYRVTEAASGRLVAEAWTRGAFVDAASGRPVRAPARFHDAFARASADAG